MRCCREQIPRFKLGLNTSAAAYSDRRYPGIPSNKACILMAIDCCTIPAITCNIDGSARSSTHQVDAGGCKSESDLQPMQWLPPGFRFHPTDEELVTYYLARKRVNANFKVHAISEVDLNKCEPWHLPGTYHDCNCRISKLFLSGPQQQVFRNQGLNCIKTLPRILG